MKRITAFLLALVLTFSLIPTMAFAKEKKTDEKKPEQSQVESDKSKKDKDDKKKDGKDKGDKDKHDKKKDGKGKTAYVPHDHEYNGYGSNPTYHWLECACGCKINVEYHVDPLNTDDDYCFCGYHFSDNAELVTLWLQDCDTLKNFRKDVLEYETNAFTYKDVKEIKRIATRTFDSEATVEIPEDLTLQEGENKIEIKVIAENKKVSQVYTVIVNKEAKK